MRVLTLETATPVEEVAVVERGAVLAARALVAGRGRAEELIVAVAGVLAESKTALRALSAIAVSAGPGRFTGLRVGLSTAKGLAAVSGVPVLPVPTLEALARSADAEAGLVAPALDARRGEVYGALFEVGGRAARILDDVAASPREFAERALNAARGRPVLLVGTGAAAYRDELSAAFGAAASFATPDLLRPAPMAIAAIAADAAGRAPDLEAVEPVYLRGV
jgi:tRNA threonylcarbamoyladenosine biosynthesis protein TsaB